MPVGHEGMMSRRQDQLPIISECDENHVIIRQESRHLSLGVPRDRGPRD